MAKLMKLSPKLHKVISITVYVLVGALAVFIAFVLFSNLSGKTVFIGGKTAMWVKTGSMEPEIPARSYILVEKSDAKNIKVGDVIIFRSDDPSIYGSLNAHRVVEILADGREFLTKGDHNPAPDNYTAKASSVLGVYKKKLPVLSSFGRFFLTPIGITITIIFVLAMILPVYLPDIIAAFREKNKKTAAGAKQAKIDELVKEEIERLNLENNQNNNSQGK